MLDFQLPTWILLAEVALLIVGLLLAALLLSDVLKQRRAPASTAAWLLILVSLPYLGVLLYLLFGARKLARPRQRLGRLPRSRYEEVEESQAHGIDLLLRGLGLAGAIGNQQVRMHESPEHALAELLRVISHAKSRVIVDMYDLADDETGRKVFSALSSKAKEGMEVLVLVDDLGSTALRSQSARQLKNAGAKLVRFRPVTRLASLRIANLRNHRKIVVADSRIAWSGGRNLANQYLSPLSQKGSWEDFSFTLIGESAAALENIALSDWQFATGERLKPIASTESFAKLEGEDASAGTAIVQIIPSGPDVRDDTWHAALLAACFTAKRRLWLVSPYFVPDEALQSALALAARRGVELHIFVPRKSDNWLVNTVRKGYLQELIHCGAQVFFYRPRMLHAKVLLMDDSFAAAGTANLDARSFFLNYEVMTAFYSHQEIAGIGAYIRALLPDCSQTLKPAHWLKATLSAPLKLLAPLL
jgi:cardiolipin synthase A/B